MSVMDSLKLSVLTPHHATEGCKCRECFGLTRVHARVDGPRLRAAPHRSPVEGGSAVASQPR
jgi:hypothetical protein